MRFTFKSLVITLLRNIINFTSKSIAHKPRFFICVFTAFCLGALFYHFDVRICVDGFNTPDLATGRWNSDLSAPFITNQSLSLDYILFLTKWKKQLVDLNLLEDPTAFIEYDGRESSGHPPFVTSISSNHYQELLGYIENLQTVIRNFSLIVYDLGLTRTERTFLHKVKNVTLRTFSFCKYPSHVENLFEYRWKALVIADVMKDLNVFWYTDPSVNWKHGNLKKEVYSKFTCATDGSCNRSPVTLFGAAGFMLMLTDPRMFTYFPVNKNSLSNIPMYAATHGFFIKAKESTVAIRTHVLCSLEKNCMAPPGSKEAGCKLKFTSPEINKFQGCHRFDQSAINLILFELNKHNTSRFSLEPSGYASINRGRFAKNPSKIISY